MVIAMKEEFWESWVIVPLITFSYLQHGLGNFLGLGIGLMKKSYHLSGLVLISAIVNIGLNFLFVPRWGLLGAAFATMISYAVWNCLKAYYSAEFYGVRFEMWRLLHITGTGFGLYGLSLLVADNGSLASNISIKFLLLLSYPAILFLTGFFYDNEQTYLLRLLSRLRQTRSHSQPF